MPELHAIQQAEADHRLMPELHATQQAVEADHRKERCLSEWPSRNGFTNST